MNKDCCFRQPTGFVVYLPLDVVEKHIVVIGKFQSTGRDFRVLEDFLPIKVRCPLRLALLVREELVTSGHVSPPVQRRHIGKVRYLQAKEEHFTQPSGVVSCTSDSCS